MASKSNEERAKQVLRTIRAHDAFVKEHGYSQADADERHVDNIRRAIESGIHAYRRMVAKKLAKKEEAAWTPK